MVEPMLTPARLQEVASLLRVEAYAQVLVEIEPEEWDSKIGDEANLRPELRRATAEGLLERFEGYHAWRLTEQGREVRSKILRMAALT